ncbi:MAG: peptidyl-tRNA hydrolase, PTH1 family [Verrucomicrobia bacterium]|nr:MAG: peptidyl-tRNA hydrolase, PTH1 family [Verrucomicrobiota bacterium]
MGGESQHVLENGTAKIRLVAGLGNPGPAYLDTRHNVGFMIVERFVAAAGEPWATEKRWDCRIAKVADTWFIKPQTFMNLSGRAVSKVSAFFKIAPEEILAVHDDVALPLGRIRLRASGSAGGHNGIKSMIAELGSSNFPRLKVGIDGKRSEADLADFVLAQFSRAEAETLEKTLQDSVAAIGCVLDSGLTVAMNRFNQDPETVAKAKPKTARAANKPSTNQPDAEPRS